MIAHIRLEADNLVLPREKAEELQLKYIELVGKLIGRKESELDEPLKCFNPNYYHFISSLEDRDGNYYKGEEQISNYYLLAEPTAHEKTQDLVLVLPEQFVNLLDFAENCPLAYKVLKTIKQKNTEVSSLMSAIIAVEEKLERVSSMKQQLDLSFNDKCNVHIAGGLLVTFNQTQLMNDCCTDALQEQLVAGWRIIACCVQPDQRRPDYILGRYVESP